MGDTLLVLDTPLYTIVLVVKYKECDFVNITFLTLSNVTRYIQGLRY